MSYIGRGIDQIDNISTLDNLSFNGSDTVFNLTQNSVAFNIVSVDALQIQIDGIIQVGNFTQTGASQITFDFTPNSGSVCNSVKHFGVGIITSVSDGAVTTAKLGADSVNGSKIADDSISDEHLDITAITGQTAITSLADTDKFLVSDASDSGNLKYVEKQYMPSGAMTLIQQERSDGTASNVSFVQKFTSSYYMYKLIGIVSSYDNNVILKARFLNNTTEQDGTYYRHLWNAGRIDTSNSISASRVGNQAESFASLSDGQAQNNADSPLHLDLTFYDPARAMGGFSAYNGNISWINVNGKFTVGTAGAVYRNSTTIDGFRIFASSGNVRYYDLKLYGLANA